MLDGKANYELRQPGGRERGGLFYFLIDIIFSLAPPPVDCVLMRFSPNQCTSSQIKGQILTV